MFKLLPILDKMEVLYRLPRNRSRFDTYLSMLQGEDGAGMVLPIAAYNPMAKEGALEKLCHLKNCGAEEIAAEVISKINDTLDTNYDRELSVVINLADDIGGSWSSRYTTDYTSKFSFGSILKRDFCTPYFWTSEDFSTEMIRLRVAEYLHRSMYWITHNRPITLTEHIDQEAYVSEQSGGASNIMKQDVSAHEFFLEHGESKDYGLIFNFLYGDKASQELNYKTYGMRELAGFKYAEALAAKNNDAAV